MSAIFQQLQSSCNIHLPVPYEVETRAWDFKQKLQEQDTDFFRVLLQRQGSLSFEYEVCCTQLAQESLCPENQPGNQHALIEHLIATLMLAEMLEHLYTCYLYAPSRMGRLRRDQGHFRSLLAKRGYQFQAPPGEKETWFSIFIRKIEALTTQLNFPRVLMTRIRSLLNTLDRLVKSDGFHHGVELMNKYVGPVLSHLVWVFFAPGLLANLGLLLWRTIQNPGMTNKAKGLGWQSRLASQWDLRWFDLAQAAVWVGVGLGQCFGRAAFGPWLTLVRHLFDVLFVSLRAAFEIHRMRDLKQKYCHMLDNQALSSEDRQEIRNYLGHMESRLTYETHRLCARVVSATALMLAIALTMPILASAPIIAFVGAILAVLITVFSSRLEPKKPVDHVSRLSRYGLFKPAPRDDVLIPEPLHDDSHKLV